MLDEEFNKRRANLVRELADRADPFTKRRLLDLVSRYEKTTSKTNPPLPLPSAPQTGLASEGKKSPVPTQPSSKENMVQRSTLDVLEGVLSERISVRTHHEK
jgi:hypothetical protein